MVKKLTLISILTALCLFTPAWIVAEDTKPDSAKEEPPATKGELDYEILPVYTRSVAATQMLTDKREKFAIWINNNKWIKADLGLNRESVFEFEHIEGEVKALLLHDKEKINLDELRQIVIDNAKRAARNSKVVFEEKRFVNGQEMLCLRIEGSIDFVPFTYFGYYYAGYIGTLQLTTISSPTVFNDYEFELESFLDGLEVLK